MFRMRSMSARAGRLWLNVRPVAYQPLVGLVSALAAGIAADAWWSLSAARWYAFSVLGLVAWRWCWGRRVDGWALVFLLGSVGALGAAWHHDRWSLFAHDEIGRRVTAAPHPVCVVARVAAAPRWSPAGPPHPMSSYPRREETELVVWVERIRAGESWQPASGLARLVVPGQRVDLGRGDRVQVFAFGAATRRPLNPGEFDVARYERGQRRLCLLHAKSPAAITRLQRGSAWSVLRMLDHLRAGGTARLQRCVGPTHAGLAAALLLGARDRLDDDLERGFFVTGLAHLLAISGLNVAIFAYGFWAVARLGFFPRRGAIVLAAALAVLYALLTDAQPPVARAAVLVVCVCVARLLGRRGLALNTLAASGLVVLIVNPTALFQTGAQLSFLAVAVLSCGLPSGRLPGRANGVKKSGATSAAPPTTVLDPLDQLLARTRPWWRRAGAAMGRSLGEAFWTSTRVWLISLPLVVVRFHLVSPIALLLNPLLMLPTAVSLYAGFGVLVLGDASLGLGVACGWICDRALELIAAAIALGQRVPGNHVFTPSPPAWWLWLYLVGLTAAPGWDRHGFSRRWLWAAYVLWMLVGSVLADPDARRRGSTRETLECTFVAVGHGTAVVLRTPEGRTLLYDCGRLGWPTLSARCTAGVLWERGVRHLDAVVLSHADTDHYNGVPDLLSQFSVGVVYVSPSMFAHPSPPLMELRESLAKARVPCRTLATGDACLLTKGVRIEVLHPLPRPGPGSDNSQSLVLAVEYLGRRILLPGDLESPGLEDVLAEEPLACDVIMAPHHGSLRSDPRGFAAWTTPRHVVISGAGNRDDGHVRRAYERLGARCWHTARDGAVTVRIGPSGLEVSSFVPR